MSARNIAKRKVAAQLLATAESFLDQLAQLSPGAVSDFESAIANDAIVRRIAFYSLTRSGAELVNALKQRQVRAATYVRAADRTDRYVARLRSLTDLMEAASLRLRVAVCSRQDFEWVQAEVAVLPVHEELAHV